MNNDSKSSLIQLLILLLSFSYLSGQSDYLDQDYGVDGIVTIESWGYPYFSQNLAVDSLGRAYLGVMTLYIDSDTTKSRYFFIGIDENGQQKDWSTEINFEDTFTSFFEDALWHEKYLYTNDKILSIEIIESESDTLQKIKRYDLDLNKEVVYESIAEFESLVSWSYFYFLLEDGPELDASFRLTSANNGIVYRHLENGSIDESFGDQGSVRIFAPATLTDNSYTNLNSKIFLQENGGTLYSTLRFEEMDDGTAYEYGQLARIDEEGELDRSFGKEGYVTGDNLSHFFGVEEAFDSGIFVLGWGTVDSCQGNNYFIMKLTENGALDQSFADNGLYTDYSCETDYHVYDFIQGPGGEILTTFFKPIYNIDSSFFHYEYYFNRIDQQGKTDSIFGDQGRVYLDFIPGGWISEIALDDEYNVYISSIDSIAFDYEKNDIYISKINANKIWTNVPATAADPLELLIYPNPSLGSSPRLKNEGRKRTGLTISLYDVIGRLVTSKAVPELDRDEEISLSDRTLSAGTHLVKVSDSITRSTFWEKVVVVE